MMRSLASNAIGSNQTSNTQEEAIAMFLISTPLQGL